MPFSIVRNDIARVRAEVLVNAANERLSAGGGVCGAIFDGAGAGRMAAACAKIGHCPTGSAVTTPGFDLPCRWVVHAVGPIWRGGSHGERNHLQGCYRSGVAEVVPHAVEGHVAQAAVERVHRAAALVAADRQR